MAIKDVRGLTAVVTGGAGGIGLGTARMLARHGANIALADIKAHALEAAVADVARFGTQVQGFPLDVSDREAVYRAADAVEAAFGKVHILFNNAGVDYSGLPLDRIDDANSEWCFAVNTFGPLWGFKAFAPKLIRHREGGHIVNTSGLMGLQVSARGGVGPYAGSKFGVVALSVGMEEAMAPYGIGVSVLCPAATRTTAYLAHEVRPDRFGGPFEREIPESHLRAVSNGMDPDLVGLMVLEGIRNDDFFILTHPSAGPLIQEWHDRIMRGVARAAEIRAQLGIPDDAGLIRPRP